MTRPSRITLSVAVVLAVLSGLASTGQIDDATISPWYDDPTEAELAFYDAQFPCPVIDGLESNGRSVNVSGEVSIRCDYRASEGGGSHAFTLRWLKSGYGYYATSFCADPGERQDDGSYIRDVVTVEPTAAVRADLSLNGGQFEEAIRAAVMPLLSAALPFSRDCAEVPTMLDCPEVPGHPLTVAPQPPSELQPDTFEFGCAYDGSSPDANDRFYIEVWWAARRGVPELYDRLCNEPESDGVGFGVVVADGVAANATYWRYSPLEGPDIEVARGAAQQLLDQAAAVARDCSEAEVLPTDFAPFPDYLEAEFDPALIGSGGSGLGGLPGAPASGGDDGFVQTLLRVGSVVMLILSLVGLFITFLLIRRENRIRERRDLLRIGITVAVALASILVVGRDAPLWAVLVAIGLGVAVGTWQGSNLLVRSTSRGLLARRSTLAMVAFGAGIVLMQVAGILNRTGAVTLGVAAAFLAAAITTGLFLGRKPRIVEALAATSRVVLPFLLLAGVVAGFGSATGSAQTAPVGSAPGTCGRSGLAIDLSNCPGYEHLLDVVPWHAAFVNGGLWWGDGKPAAPIPLPRGLTGPPDPVSQTVAWSTTDDAGTITAYEVTETYEFGTLTDGTCCTVSYEGSGTRTFTLATGEVTTDEYVVSGRLEDVQPVGSVPLGRDPYAIPFTEVLTLRGMPEDSCQRVVAWRQNDNEAGAATWDSVVINGEASTNFVSSEVNLFVDCDLADFSYEKAFSLAPPIPAADDPIRVIGGPDGPGEVCPVRQEFLRYVWNAGLFDGVQTQTLADLYLEPNAPQCDYGGLFDPLSFGQGGRGQTRHEILYRLAILNDPVAEAARLADDEDTFFSQGRTTSVSPHERCEVGADGVPMAPPEGETCRYISIHSPGAAGVSNVRNLSAAQVRRLKAAGGTVYIETEYVPDGPNVWVRAHLPWGKYVYRCHHCTPGDPRITRFIGSLHRFGANRGAGDPDAGKGEVAPTPPPEGDGTVGEPDPAVQSESEPVGEDEGISEEQAALIGLVGLLGSIGLLGASLEGTGLTPADIAAAIRRGDLTGGVAAAPALLDEHDEPLFVNDGSYPEAPVGHVWWGTGGDSGRWVSPEEAQELVAEARAAEAALEQDRAEALDAMMEQADADWQELIRRSRAGAAADRMQAAMGRAEREALAEGTSEAWEAALAAGQQDLVDFIDRSDTLTAEQIQAVFDAINRRGADEAALAAIPEVNVWRETATGTLEDLAKAAEAAGQPGVAWILRNPLTAARVGAAVATGGYSEFVAVPLDITNRLQAAQDKSIRENGRMMTSAELFGELGWALGTEALYEAGGRLVGHGIGRVFSSGDELAEAALRQGDETLPVIRGSTSEAVEAGVREGSEELSEAAAKEASGAAERTIRAGEDVIVTVTPHGAGETAEAVSRESLEEAAEQAGRGAGEASEAAGREGAEAVSRESLEEAAEQAGRGAGEASEAAGREGAEAATRQVPEELMPPPPKGNEAIRDLDVGTRIDDELVPQTGLSRQHVDELQDYMRENDLNATGRATNPHSGRAIEEGALQKPVEVKIKTGTDLDVLLGARAENRGVVTLFEPKMPDTRGMSPELVDALNRRYTQRLNEWNKYQADWALGQRVTEFGGVERTHRLNEGRIEVLFDGQWRKVGGDFDLVDLTRADGTPLSPAEFQRHVDALVERGLIQHGGEVRVMTDLMRSNPHPPGSEAWMEAARKAWDLRNSLENAHLDGGEIVIGINGTHGLHRAPDIDDVLPWRGGFEGPDGVLIDFKGSP